MRNKSKTKTLTLSDAQADILMAWLPWLVLFIIIPFVIYLPIQIEYEYNFAVVFPFVMLAVLCCISSFVLYFVPATLSLK